MSHSELNPNRLNAELSEKEIINKVFAQINPKKLKKEYLLEETDGGIPTHEYNLSFGGKNLEITASYNHGSFLTYIDNNSEEKELNATTYLYAAAKIIMQDITNKFKKPMTYGLQTGNEKMRAWAETKGKDIFSWDTTEDRWKENGNKNENKYRYLFIKKFVPEEEKHE